MQMACECGWHVMLRRSRHGKTVLPYWRRPGSGIHHKTPGAHRAFWAMWPPPDKVAERARVLRLYDAAAVRALGDAVPDDADRSTAMKRGGAMAPHDDGPADAGAQRTLHECIGDISGPLQDHSAEDVG